MLDYACVIGLMCLFNVLCDLFVTCCAMLSGLLLCVLLCYASVCPCFNVSECVVCALLCDVVLLLLCWCVRLMC